MSSSTSASTKQGALYGFIFQYMPIGRSFTLDLMPTPQQRLWMWRRSWEIIRERQIFLADFWNHGTLSQGCISAGRDNGGGYLYVDWNGAVSPCVFMPYSPVNINDVLRRGQDAERRVGRPVLCRAARVAAALPAEQRQLADAVPDPRSPRRLAAIAGASTSRSRPTPTPPRRWWMPVTCAAWPSTTRLTRLPAARLGAALSVQPGIASDGESGPCQRYTGPGMARQEWGFPAPAGDREGQEWRASLRCGPCWACTCSAGCERSGVCGVRPGRPSADRYRAPPPLTMGEMPFLAALGLFAAWRCVALLISLGQENMRPVIAAASLAVLVLLAAAHRFRQP